LRNINKDTTILQYTNYNKFTAQKRKKCVFSLLFFTINYLVAQETSSSIVIDSEKFIYEIKFDNETGNTLYFRGPIFGGFGEYWIFENNEKRIILEAFNESKPAITWHTEYLAEIHLLEFTEDIKTQGGHSYFFDFRDNVISQRYYFPIYIDIKNNYVITLDGEGLNVYNIKTNELIKQYKQDGMLEGVETFWYYYFNYKINIENNELTFSYHYHPVNNEEVKRSIKFEYNY
jgi:hypothetical protein